MLCVSVAHVGVHPGHLTKIIYKLEENQPSLCKIFSVVYKSYFVLSLPMRRMHLVVKPLWMSHTEEKEDETDKKDADLPLK